MAMASLEQKAAQENVSYVIQNLRAVYGIPERSITRKPLDELILTILSQSTTNINSNRTFSRLKSRFTSWDEARMADRAEIEEAIKSGGLAKQKSGRIKSILSEIHSRTGETSLDFLCELDVPRASAFLSSLKGVGPITVACTLLFGCGRAVFPVDVHIMRIASRLGLISERCTDSEAHRILAAAVPAENYYEAHINMIRHGREICRPRAPKCETCCLVDYCEFYRPL